MTSAPDILAAVGVELFLFSAAGAFLYRFWRYATFLPQRKTLAPFHKGVLLEGDRVVRVVDKASCWVKPKQTLVAIDSRPRPVQTSLRDLPTADGLFVRLRCAGEYKVTDVAQFVRGSHDGHSATYLAIEREIAHAVTELDRKELLASRYALADRVRERVEPRAAELGVLVTSLEVSDLIPIGWTPQGVED